MARRRKNTDSGLMNGWVIIGGIILGGFSLFSGDDPKEPETTPNTQQVQSLMQSTPATTEPVKIAEESTATSALVAPVAVSKSDGDHSNAPLIKTEQKKAAPKANAKPQAAEKTKAKKSRSESVTYLKDDGAGYSSKCGGKRLCKQMSSCAEAQFYLRQCGLDRLDRDGDGVPCESLCLGKKKRR